MTVEDLRMEWENNNKEKVIQQMGSYDVDWKQYNDNYVEHLERLVLERNKRSCESCVCADDIRMCTYYPNPFDQCPYTPKK